MTLMRTFESPDEPLEPLLREIQQGKIQLPEFQRRWIWDDEHIRSLLASVSRSFPIGVIMLLQAGGDDVRFKTTPLAGAPNPAQFEPERLVLDGQQRLTSLYQALLSDQAVYTKNDKGKHIRRYYYIDINKALDPTVDREETISGVDEERKLRLARGQVVDVSQPEKVFELGWFPVAHFLDSSNWRTAYEEFWDYDREKIQLFNAFHREVIQRFEQYQIPAIVLKKETPKEAVCHVFEKVNTGGVALTVFDLLTATFAIDNYSLKDDWDRRRQEFAKLDHPGHGNKSPLRRIENTDFLQAVALLATRERSLRKGGGENHQSGISCKRKALLSLTLNEYKQWADAVTGGYLRAAKMLFGQKIFSERDLPYRTQLTPLAAIFALLDRRAEAEPVQQKLLRWYWCGVFGELYGGSIESRFARDLPEVLAWIEGGAEPSTIVDANFNPVRLRSMRTRQSAAYRGLHALLIRDGANDFKTGQPIDVSAYFDEAIDIHHIFPRAWFGYKKDERAECIINKTPLSATTNRVIGGAAPSEYLPKLEKRYGIEASRMNEILETHNIDPRSLRLDDFDAFFVAREEAILQRIERAIGKPIPREVAPDAEEGYGDFEEEVA